MKAKVVYLMGAGFSAGLGLPVTATFLSRALRDASPEPSILNEVLDRIDELSGVKNFFRADLFNNEEALSILEIDEVAAARLMKRHYIFLRLWCDSYVRLAYLRSALALKTRPIRDSTCIETNDQ